MQLTRILLLYFVMGAVMFGGGAVQFDDSGVTQYFISDQTGEPSDQAQGELSGLDSAIASLVGQVGGAIQLVWNLVFGIVLFLNWPLTVMLDNGVPPRVSILFGGSLTVMFYGSLITLVRSSA